VNKKYIPFISRFDAMVGGKQQHAGTEQHGEDSAALAPALSILAKDSSFLPLSTT
jgi:hypothetical protein